MELNYPLIVTLVALVCVWLVSKSAKSGGKKKKVPPSPPALPVIGNLYQIGPLHHRSLWELSKKYGPIMLLRLGSKPALVVSSGEVAKEFLKTHDLAFSEKPTLKARNRIFYSMMDLAYSPYGEQWRRLRSIFVHELMSTSKVKSYSSMRSEEIALMVDKIREHGESSTPVNLSDMLTGLMYDLVSRAGFGKKHSQTEHGRQFLKVLGEGVALLLKFTIGEFIPWLAWLDKVNGFDSTLDTVAKKGDVIMDAVIEEHLNAAPDSNKDNFIDIMLGIYKGETPGVTIDLKSVKGLMLDIFGAGTETSSTALIWAMAELIRHPAVMKKVQDEVRGVMKGRQHMTDEDVEKMPYLRAVIKETLRMHPSFPVYSRIAREPVNVLGYDIAPRTMVFFNAFAIGRDPTVWDDPEKFMPERFLNSSVDFRGFDFQLIPFGGGRRICPGLAFAALSNAQIIGNLVHKFDWALPGGAKPEDLDVSEKSGVAIGKKIPLMAIATPVANP